MKNTPKAISIKNRTASFEYEFLADFTAGIVLLGSEIKSIRGNNVSIDESYCYIENGEVFVRNMHIGEYPNASYQNHDPIRIRKLLLNKSEIWKLGGAAEEKSLTIIVRRLYTNEEGRVKLHISLAKGKKLHDKRNSIKDKDNKRDLDRIKKENAN